MYSNAIRASNDVIRLRVSQTEDEKHASELTADSNSTVVTLIATKCKLVTRRSRSESYKTYTTFAFIEQ